MSHDSPLQYDPTTRLSRRELLSRCGMGFGMVGLAGVLAADDRLGSASAVRIGAPGPLGPMAPHSPQFTAKAKQVVHLFMNGGPSHIDTFDPKPMLTKYHGKTLPGPALRTERKTGAALGSPFQFKKYGESGIEVSELFARTALSHVDDLCVIRSMYADVPNHEPSLMLMNCGDGRLQRPAWDPGSLTDWARKTRICRASSRCVPGAIRSWQPRTGGRHFYRVPTRERTSTRSTPRSKS